LVISQRWVLAAGKIQVEQQGQAEVVAADPEMLNGFSVQPSHQTLAAKVTELATE
jgi:hypothetical protein